jgi:hypothetical protein
VDAVLYRSRKGRYYEVISSRIQGQSDSAEFLSNEEATRWLIAYTSMTPDSDDFPAELRSLVDAVTE